MATPQWRLWYADGSTYGSDDGPPERAPGYGVILICQPDPTPGVGNVGYMRISANFYYYRTDVGRWMPAELEGDVMEQLLAREPIVGVCRGRWLPDERFAAIRAQAAAWAEAQGWPRKSGYRPGERLRFGHVN